MAVLRRRTPIRTALLATLLLNVAAAKDAVAGEGLQLMEQS